MTRVYGQYMTSDENNNHFLENDELAAANKVMKKRFWGLISASTMTFINFKMKRKDGLQSGFSTSRIPQWGDFFIFTYNE